jgi:hypothetical protein
MVFQRHILVDRGCDPSSEGPKESGRLYIVYNSLYILYCGYLEENSDRSLTSQSKSGVWKRSNALGILCVLICITSNSIRWNPRFEDKRHL